MTWHGTYLGILLSEEELEILNEIGEGDPTLALAALMCGAIELLYTRDRADVAELWEHITRAAGNPMPQFQFRGVAGNAAVRLAKKMRLRGQESTMLGVLIQAARKREEEAETGGVPG